MRRDSASTKGDSFTPAGNKDDLPYQPGSLEGGCQIRSEQRNGASHSILRWAKAILLFDHVASDNRIQLYSPFFFFASLYPTDRWGRFASHSLGLAFFFLPYFFFCFSEAKRHPNDPLTCKAPRRILPQSFPAPFPPSPFIKDSVLPQ